MLKQKTFAGNALEETISLVQSGPLIIDGCLFKILKLRVHGDVYVSGRKGYPCLNVQATCDGASRFTSVDISFPGSVHDARVYRESGLRKKLEQLGADQPYHVLANKAYSVDPQVMPAFKINSRVPNATAFNVVHTRQRIMIKHIFGQVKRRFPGLGNVIRIKTQRIPDFTQSVLFSDDDDYDFEHDE